ncbi:TetR/AcrR family transcriptional regulator [Amycolatopsis sp. NPDC051903]|uniref:TetR/AcrR family transcriptional regulator n=1 Tax=Amycolatopsis sp. NPDC051903 TaxID=3363936 RepID=UPI0037B95622
MPHDQKTPSRMGRPPLTERRKAETRLEVARAAVRLFLARGVAGTSGEDIAEAAGISPRTLWRYFPTKESCIMPLLTGGIETTARQLRSWRNDQDLADLLATARPPLTDTADDARTMLRLVRLTRTEPGLRAVWLEAHRAAEPVFAEALAHRAGLPEPDLVTTVQAAMLNVALRVAVEHYASHDNPDAADYDSTIREALLVAAGSFTS